MLELTKEQAQEWAKALRSGEYKQHCGYWFGDDDDNEIVLDDAEEAPIPENASCFCCLSVLKASGLVDSKMDLDRVRASGLNSKAFIQLNDDLGATFDQIADLIEGEVTFDELVQELSHGED